MQKVVSKKHAPFLFLGSGFSRHYLNTPDWKGVLEMFAPKHINQYFSMLNTNSLPCVASSIAKDLTDQFWQLSDDDDYKLQHIDQITDQSVILKIKISDYLKKKSLEDFPKEYTDEIELLKGLCIDGIITTNWDDTAERIFPKFTTYVGQQELIFSSTYNIGEIYKIHGCFRKPSSLVLTESDYNNYNKNNAYLAAKLITIFIEHPIVFLGYSISDINIIELLRSLVGCMDKPNLDKLRDNLIFVDWSNSKEPVFRIDSHTMSLSNDILLPVTKIETNSYQEVYECLRTYERTIPANLLREYKKQFYDIVVSEKPEKQLLVLPDNKIDANDKIQFVCGFGAVSMYKSAIGYIGLKASDILEDIIDDKQYDPLQVLTQSIPNLRKGGQKKSFLPIYKYLSAIGIHSNEEYDANTYGIKIGLYTLSDFQSYNFSDEDKLLNLDEAIRKYKSTPWKAVALIPYLNVRNDELEVLRNFIKANFNDFIVKEKKNATHMRKLICFYDLRMYGWK